MTDFLRERVPRVPPMSMAAIEEIATKFLEELQPSAIAQAERLDILGLVDTKLQQFGVFVYPASYHELGNRHAATDPSDPHEIRILLSESLWDDLLGGGRGANMARATIAHELGHAVLHVRTIRRRLSYAASSSMLNRVSRESLRPFEDPEWQSGRRAGVLAKILGGSRPRVAPAYQRRAADGVRRDAPGAPRRHPRSGPVADYYF